MATTHNSTAPKRGFLDLPGEIRNIIYRILLTKTYAYRQNAYSYAPLHPTILRSNRQIHSEAVKILHGENVWIIAEVSTVNWLLPSQLVPNVSGKDASKIKYPALRINFAVPTTSEVPQSHMTLIMGEESIEIFIRWLWRIPYKVDTYKEFRMSSLHLTLCKTPFHNKSELQLACLKPFRLVCGLRNLTIQGQVEPACVEEILHGAESGFETLAPIQIVAQDYLNKGNKAYFARKSRTAVDQFVNGAEFLNHVSFWKLSKNATHSHTHFHTLAPMIDVMVLRCAMGFLACGSYKKAKMLGQGLLKSPNLPKKGRVQATLCTARAHRALGEGEDESRLFEEALKADDRKSIVLYALVRLFPSATPELMRLMVEQHRKCKRGEAIDIDAIRTIWETA